MGTMPRVNKEMAKQYQKSFKALRKQKGWRAKRRKRCWRCHNLYIAQWEMGEVRHIDILTAPPVTYRKNHTYKRSLSPNLKRITIVEPICPDCISEIAQKDE